MDVDCFSQNTWMISKSSIQKYLEDYGYKTIDEFSDALWFDYNIVLMIV